MKGEVFVVSMSDAPAEAQQSVSEHAHDAVSADVGKVVDHLRANRTTEGEARTIRDAADRSIADHGVAKSLRRLP